MDWIHYAIIFLISINVILTAPVHSKDRIVLSNGLLTSDIVGDNFLDDAVSIVEDGSLALIYKPNAVYQVPVPQELTLAEEEVVETEDPSSTVQSLEQLQKYEEITLSQFIELTGIKENAQKAFSGFDENGDGVLTKKEIIKVEMHLTAST